jgi:hypothetical protein
MASVTLLAGRMCFANPHVLDSNVYCAYTLSSDPHVYVARGTCLGISSKRITLLGPPRNM